MMRSMISTSHFQDYDVSSNKENVMVTFGLTVLLTECSKHVSPPLSNLQNTAKASATEPSFGSIQKIPEMSRCNSHLM